MLRIIYMGTPYFAVPALETLIKHAAPGNLLPGGYEIVTVITRPDKPSGRGHGVTFSPVKQCALAHNIPVWQPGSFKKANNSSALAAYHADLYIVAAFGQILPQAVLDQPRYGTLNIHASLLPKYRGANPISEAILHGENETGVSIMLLDAGIDTGPVLLRRGIPINPDETTGTLTEKLANLGSRALLEALPFWVEGKITPEAQDETLASHTRMLRKEDGEIDWSKSAQYISRQVRAYSPWPGAYTHWKGKLLKIIAAHPLDSHATPPAIVGAQKISGQQVLTVTTSEGTLAVEHLQLEGKRAMTSDEFLRGYGQIVGQLLG